jgi:hypothetical protein
VTYELEGPDVYQGMNPAFVRRVWAKRREKAGIRRVPAGCGRPTKWTPGQIEEIAEMLRGGLTSGQIAGKFGVTVGSISGVVHRTPELKAIGFRTGWAEKLRRGPAA